MAAPAHVDDLRIRLPDVVNLNAEPCACIGQEVGQEDVGVLTELQKDSMAVWMIERETDAALTPVRMLHQWLKRSHCHPAGPEAQTSLRIAHHRVLDLDDVGTPVGQDGTSSRSEGELGDLDHLDALHRLVHRVHLSVAVGR
jgi:hypothetical protein